MKKETRTGACAGICAYAIWGLGVIYFRAADAASAWEILAHRMLWSGVFLLPVMLAWRQLPTLIGLLRHRRTCLGLLASSIIVSTNWLIFIWAVNNERILHTSLGYFINPIVFVLLARPFLGERLPRRQWPVIGLALCGVAIQVWQAGALPWVALALSLTFSGYGILRKRLGVPALAGAGVEFLLLCPAGLALLIILGRTGGLAWMDGPPAMRWLLPLAGVVTATPFFLFGYAAVRMRMTTLGLLQYIAPTLSFLLGVFVYGEPMDGPRLLSFVCIWIALILYGVTARKTSASIGETAEPGA